MLEVDNLSFNLWMLPSSELVDTRSEYPVFLRSWYSKWILFLSQLEMSWPPWGILFKLSVSFLFCRWIDSIRIEDRERIKIVDCVEEIINYSVTIKMLVEITYIWFLLLNIYFDTHCPRNQICTALNIISVYQHQDVSVAVYSAREARHGLFEYFCH